MVPPLVERARAVATRLAFERSCSEETGRLLHLLSGQRGRSRVAEIGAGAGVGAAWILSGLQPQATFVSVEPDRERAAAVTELLAGDEHARVLHGEWRRVLPAEGPFDLVFADGGGFQTKTDETLLGLLAPGGTLVLDDLTPGRTGSDSVRDLWLRHPRVSAVELRVSEREAVILAVLQSR
ncbi:MAG: class I SAM-dependent methyltransferase [Gaiellaceae bacterium]